MKRGPASRLPVVWTQVLLRGSFVGAGLLLNGCHHQQQVAYAPPPPRIESKAAHSDARRTDADTLKSSTNFSAPAWEPTPPGDLDAEAAAAPPGYFDDFHQAPVFHEVGEASWYGPNYN